MKNELTPTSAAAYLERLAERLHRLAASYDYGDDGDRALARALGAVAEEIEAVLREK